MLSSRLQQRFAFWWLALALVLAPALGRMHQMLHVPQTLGMSAVWHAATAVRYADPAAAAVQGTVKVLDAPHGLFASHAGADCLLLDQQLLGGALLTTAPAAPLVYAPLNTQLAPPTTARLGARRLWACLARAPPAQA